MIKKKVVDGEVFVVDSNEELIPVKEFPVDTLLNEIDELVEILSAKLELEIKGVLLESHVLESFFVAVNNIQDALGEGAVLPEILIIPSEEKK